MYSDFSMAEVFKCKLINRSKNNNGQNSAFLATFANGRIEHKNGNKLKFEAYQSAETADGLLRKKIRRVLVADSGRLQYAGYSYGPDASERGNLCKFHVGVLNKKKGRMKIYDTQLFHCKPILTTAVTVEPVNDKEGEKNYMERVDLLTSAFGSKRKKRAMESRQRYSVADADVEAAAAEALEKADIDKDVTKTKSSKATTSQSEIPEAIPPQNRSSSSVENVFKLNDIISAEEYIALQPEADIFKKATSEDIKKWTNDATFGRYILGHSDEFKDNHKAKLLSYYNFLVQLMKLGYKDLRKKDPLPLISEPFKQSLLNRFTVNARSESGRTYRSLPQRMKDKIIAYSLVLALFIDEFRIDLGEVQTDFRVALNRITKIANALGCHVSNKSSAVPPTKIAELKLPLYVLTDKPFRGGPKAKS